LVTSQRLWVLGCRMSITSGISLIARLRQTLLWRRDGGRAPPTGDGVISPAKRASASVVLRLSPRKGGLFRSQGNPWTMVLAVRGDRPMAPAPPIVPVGARSLIPGPVTTTS